MLTLLGVRWNHFPTHLLCVAFTCPLIWGCSEQVDGTAQDVPEPNPAEVSPEPSDDTETVAEGEPACANVPAVAAPVPSELYSGSVGTTYDLEAMVIRNSVQYPTRLAVGPGRAAYFTDAKVGAVFILDGITPFAQLSGLDRPLGLAVDSRGNIYVGNDGRNNVEKYSPEGKLELIFGEGELEMPNQIGLDSSDNVYVVDSRSHVIKVYSSNGQWHHNIGHQGDGEGGFYFPSALFINETAPGDPEIYVADQGHGLIQVFDLAGNFHRSFGGLIGAYSSDYQGKFVTLQSITLDDSGHLHVLDSYQNRIQILDAQTGCFLGAYGELGSESGQLRVPLDMVMSEGELIVTNSGNPNLTFFALAD